ncbi:hypothetical protein CJ030_MR8G018165 [Morella rubra]|uniref:Uncharacterized protein n=1 Tax=Morella rubra TaxID=262757 RepID=A0A6A1UP38_9ROSI|nr:hypothetical protein CJ030_MR8G018165 [Morella rubra]
MASARARKRGAPAPLTDHDSPAMPMLGRPASQLQTCHGKPMASTKAGLDIVPQQDFGHQPNQPVEDDQEWLPTAATSGGGAPPPLAVTKRDVTSMARGVEGASPPMEEMARPMASIVKLGVKSHPCVGKLGFERELSLVV